MQARRATIEQTGGPEVISWRDIGLAAPGEGEALIRHEAVGVNFIDTYHRSGLYPIELPGPLGSEAAGVVEAIGPGVDSVAPGDRVATLGPTRGAYATANVVPARELFVLPDAIGMQTAAAVTLKGLTVQMLAERVAPVAAGEWALVHAAAGATGLLLVQWLAARGVRVIGTASTPEKRARASEAGAGIMVDSRSGDIAAAAMEATGGTGVAVSYDGVGASSWASSLAATRCRGTVVSFGNASGPVEGVALGTLAKHGSLFVTRPTLFDYLREADERARAARQLWAMIADKKVAPQIGQTYPLEDAARAHTELEERRTTGSSLLLPGR